MSLKGMFGAIVHDNELWFYLDFGLFFFFNMCDLCLGEFDYFGRWLGIWPTELPKDRINLGVIELGNFQIWKGKIKLLNYSNIIEKNVSFITNDSNFLHNVELKGCSDVLVGGAWRQRAHFDNVWCHIKKYQIMLNSYQLVL